MPGPKAATGSNSLRDVALLFALPTSRAEFDEVFDGHVLLDYCAITFGSKDREAIWDGRYARIVARAEALIELARAHGAAVFLRAQKRDITTATRSHAVVIFLGHWRGSVIELADLSEDLATLLERTKIHQGDPGLATLCAATTREELASEMNAVLTRSDVIQGLPPDIANAAAANPALALTLGRDLLDGAFAGLLRRGNQVEMFDGLHNPGDIEAAIDPDFAGELDLTMCDSISLATLLDLRRHGAVRHVHWPEIVDPLPQYMLIDDALRQYMMAPPPTSYIDIRLARHRAL